MQNIGFIGLGNMGGRVASAIASKGYPLYVFDLSGDATKVFKEKANISSSVLQVLEKSEIVFLSLPSSKQVMEVINVFLEAEVNGKIIVDTSTSYPITTKELYKKLLLKGCRFVDMPLSGAPADADKGSLLALFGGDEELFEQLKPVVACFANRYVRLGESGSGHVAKLIFNFIALSYVNTYAMAFPLAEKMGLDSQQIFELLRTTSMACGVLDFYAPKMFNKTYDMAFALELAHKDLTYVKKMFEEYQVPAFALDGTLDLLRTAIRDGKGKDDYSACISTMFEYFANK